MPQIQSLREHLVAQLRGGQAYDTFDDIVGEFPPDLRGAVPDKAEHSAWQILEHMRLSLRDILEFSKNEDGSYAEKNWPDDYWPKDPNPPDSTSWPHSVKAYQQDLEEMQELVQAGDLFAKFPWGQGQTLLRETMLAADHAAYHLGQLVILRRLVG